MEHPDPSSLQRIPPGLRKMLGEGGFVFWARQRQQLPREAALLPHIGGGLLTQHCVDHYESGCGHQHLHAKSHCKGP